MFDQLFFRSDALTRLLSAPLVDERTSICGSQNETMKSQLRLRMPVHRWASCILLKRHN